ncbi:MAG TPA: peptide deformylase [Candidatus Moranbacteria bacterium]|nr:peptide deformylase [Candidatus Moranbacteria bacterium]
MSEKNFTAKSTIVTDIGANSPLRRKARSIADPTEAAVAELAEEMIRKMRSRDGIGLAAPQIGSPWRLCVLEVLPEHKSSPLVCINPVIVKASRELVMGEEGCLSLPGVFLPVVRAAKVKVRYRDLTGKSRVVEADGLLAVALQHEIDHLDGVLMTDRYALQENLRRQFVSVEPTAQTKPTDRKDR